MSLREHGRHPWYGDGAAIHDPVEIDQQQHVGMVAGGPTS
jgi:hypothetical protein